MNKAKTFSTYAALLRGINVGGKNRLPMQDLAQMFVEAGCADVRTYIQSGNVIFKASEAKAHRIDELITKRIAADFGYKIPLVMRSAQELRETVENNLFLKAGEPEATLFVYFLASLPDAARVAALDPDRSPPDKYFVRGRDIYVRMANGAADTRLTNAYFDSKLATISTARNWRTVLQVLAMMEA